MPIGPLITKEIAAVAIVAASPATIWTPTAGKKFRLMGWTLSFSAAAAGIFKEGAGSSALSQPVRTPLVGAGGTDRLERLLGDGVLSAAADNVLKLDVTANSTITGIVWGYEE